VASPANETDAVGEACETFTHARAVIVCDTARVTGGEQTYHTVEIGNANGHGPAHQVVFLADGGQHHRVERLHNFAKFAYVFLQAFSEGSPSTPVRRRQRLRPQEPEEPQQAARGRPGANLH